MAERRNTRNSSQSGLCIFCCTYLTRDITELDCAAVANHFIFIERYLGNWSKIDKTLRIPELVVKKSALIGACEKCGEIVKGFAKLYHRIKCIELKLNWKLDSLKTIVQNTERKNASKLKCASQKKAHHRAKFKKPRDELLEFQKTFLEKCSVHFKQSYPKLALKRYHPPEQEAATLSFLDSHHSKPTNESSNGTTDKSDDYDERGRGNKIRKAKLKSPMQKKQRGLNSRFKTKIKKRVPEFRIPELETLEMANDSAPSIVLYGTQSGLELDKSANEKAPEKTSKTVNLQNDIATATNITSDCGFRGNDSHTNMELAGSTSGSQINITNIAESIIKNLMLEETEATTTTVFQGDQAMSSATTCEHVSTPNLKFEEQPIFVDDDDHEYIDTMSIDDATDPLEDGKNGYDDDIVESKHETWNETPSTANDSPCDKEISISNLLKRDEPGNPITTPLIENETETTSPSQTLVKVPLKFSPLVSNDKIDAVKKIDGVTENTKNSSDESPLTPIPENESVSRFRRRFKCSQCTLTFTSEGSLESHLTSTHMQIEDLNDKDHVDGQSEFELDIEDGEYDDPMTSESDSNYDIIEEGETDEEFEEQSLKYELESDDGGTDIEASKCMKKKTSQREKNNSVIVHGRKCEKCEAWSSESGVPLHVHAAKHRYLHTNGQEALTDQNPEHLNIKWSDLKVEIGGNVVELKEEFTAPGCGRKFALKEHFDYHLRLHGSYTCANTNCETTTCCFIDLVEHETTHSSKLRIKTRTLTKCGRCKFRAAGSRNIFQHYLAVHFGVYIDMGSLEGSYCRICKFSFDKFFGCFPMPHFLNFHDLSRIDDPSKVHRCDVKDCTAYFLTFKQLEAHQQIFHFKTAKAPSITKNHKPRLKKIILDNMRKAKITEEIPHQKRVRGKGKRNVAGDHTSKSVKKRRIRRKNKYSESVRDWNCGKCEPWSKESNVHHAKHRYLHTNGQEALTDINPEHLNIKWSDLKVEIDGSVVELKEEFTAPGCGRKFALKENFDYHLRLHGSYTCANTNCETTTCCFMDLVEHETTHSSKLRIKKHTWKSCTRCKFQTQKFINIFRHYLRAHFGDIIDTRADEGNYCRICKFSFGKVSGCFPMTHFLNFHDLSRIDDSSKVHRCEVSDCAAYFLTLKQLEDHRQTHHLNWTNKLMPKRIILGEMRTAQIREDGLTVKDFVLRRGAEFRCDETSCNNAAFFTEEEMNIHLKLHGNFRCTFCETVENYAPNLCIHELEVHSGTADHRGAKDAYYIQCPRMCPKKLSGRPRYIAHHLREHLGLESDTPRCLICGVLYFLENESLEAKIFTHFQDHHDLSSLDTTGDDTVWRCTKENCKAYFLSRFQLSNHVQLMHCVKKKIRRMPCLECEKILKSQKLFSQHMLKCHPEAFQKFFPFPCPAEGCVRRCETEGTLRRHLYMSHPKQSNQHMCQVCGKYSKNAWSLTQHLKLHDEEFQKRVQENKRHFVCDQCDSIFKSKNTLDIHKLCHSGPESWTFVCEICSKKCLTKQKLEEHLRTHTKEKPFQCEHCGASYAHRHNWRIHVQKKHGAEVVTTKVYKKVNERMKAKYVKKVGDANEQGVSTSLRKRRAPRRRKDWEEEESSVGESDSSDSD